MSVNQFPYLPIVTNPKDNPCIQAVIRIATKFNHMFIGPLPTLPENFMQIGSKVVVPVITSGQSTVI